MTPEEVKRSGTSTKADGWGMNPKSWATEGREPQGRWPANIIHDGSDEVLGAFPDSNGSGPARTLKRGKRDGEGWGMADDPGMLRDAGSGSAARFFQTCKSVYDDDLWQDLNLPPEPAATADQSLSPRRQAVFFALAVAAKRVLPAESSWGVSLSALPSMSATPKELRALVESLTQAIQTIGSRFWLEPGLARLTQTLSLAQSVVSREQTDTTTITLSHWKSDGSAEPVTFSITRTNSGAGEKDSEQSTGAEHARFKYCAKASKRDRDEGLDGFAAATVSDGTSVAADNAYQRGKTERTNTHPTVKPTDLMRYLCRLVTPPGGLVLDPFTGSGSTGKAAALEGFKFLGFEREAEYVAIARARIDASVNNRYPKPL